MLDRPGFTPIKKHLEKYSAVCLNVYVLRLETGGQKLSNEFYLAFPEFGVLLISSRKDSFYT
jgi:hypothetical protein